MQILEVKKGKERELAKKAVQALKSGKVVACPTDTVYGLVADARNKKAVQRIFHIKGRESGKPLPIFVRSIAGAKELARVSKKQEPLLKKSWPGKVTVVMESKGVLPRETGTVESIGLRIPKHNLIQEILRQFGRPVTGTSANISGRPSVSDSKEIISQFQKRRNAPDLVLDAGKLPPSRPSKVLDITKDKLKVLRS